MKNATSSRPIAPATRLRFTESRPRVGSTRDDWMTSSGTGTVKGFALTLAIGVGVSFFTAVIVTQMLLHAAIEASSLRRRRLYGVEEKAPDARTAGAPVAAV